MRRSLQLAKNGIGTARPNPSVGAVIVYDNKIIGEGFTSPYGGSHAEVNAIASVKDETLLKKATIYVTLEPCAHYGKTPPCANLIIEKGIPNIVIGCLDTNSLVAGKGIEKLQNAGRNVMVNVLEDECREHHKRFFTFYNKKRPYIVLKWAQTKDGFVAPLTKNIQSPVWISNEFSRQLVHKIRAQEHAILVGTNTIISDNPKLNVRTWGGNNPVRVILDKQLKINKELYVYNNLVKTIVFNELQQNQDELTFYETINFSKNIASQICDILFLHNIQSVIIEGGTQTLQTFITENVWDEALIFIGNQYFKEGVKAPCFTAVPSKSEKIDTDQLNTFYNF